MTARKDLKSRIRQRQKKTDESYTTARLHVLRARDRGDPGEVPREERVTAIVLKCGDVSMRVRIQGEEGSVTLRTSSYDAWRVAPGQLVEVKLKKRWTWRGDAYASGSIQRAWTDIPALGLEPLPLEDQGIVNLNEVYEPFRPPDFYAGMWDFFASAPRRACEFDGIAWGDGVGVAPDDTTSCLVADAAETRDPVEARLLLMKALLADIRCIDAHVHLGNLEFDYRPEDAIVHYEIAVGIGELSLGPEFDGLLPWGLLFNRPFLRALRAQGLCLWRLGRTREAREVFERNLALNPADNQGVRFCWNDVRNGRAWSPDMDNPYEELAPGMH